MKIIHSLLLVSLCVSSYSQLVQPTPIDKEYYVKGTELLKNGYYREADSLFTLSSRSFRNQDLYYNRALCKLFQLDTVRYCQDLNIASSRYFDEIAETDFNKNCCKKIDTIYFDKSRQVTSSVFRYFEVIKYLKYDSLVIGTYHDIKAKVIRGSVDFGDDFTYLSGVKIGKSDIIATYFIDGAMKYYTSCTTPIRLSSNEKYHDIKRRAQILLNVKYGSLKSSNDLKSIAVNFLIYVDNTGEIIKVAYDHFSPKILLNIAVSDLESDLLDIAKNYPKITPAKFYNDKVNFVFYDTVEF